MIRRLLVGLFLALAISNIPSAGNELSPKPKLSSTFLQLDYCREWTPSDWDQELEDLKYVEIGTIVLQYSTNWKGEFDEPTVRQLKEACDRAGVKFFVGLSKSAIQFNPNTANMEDLLAKDKEIAERCYPIVSSSPNFSGWYLPYEAHSSYTVDKSVEVVLKYFSDISESLKHLDTTKKIIISPFVNGTRSWSFLDGEFDGQGEVLAKLVDSIARTSKIDIISIQDGLGESKTKANQLGLIYLKSAQRLRAFSMEQDGRTVELWATIELFTAINSQGYLATYRQALRDLLGDKNYIPMLKIYAEAAGGERLPRPVTNWTSEMGPRIGVTSYIAFAFNPYLCRRYSGQMDPLVKQYFYDAYTTYLGKPIKP